jgi:hypothetical protein
MSYPNSRRPLGSILSVRGVAKHAVQKPTVPASPRADLHWLVRRWGDGASRRPKRMYATRDAAEAEALRLSALSENAGALFLVLECRCVRKVRRLSSTATC